MDHSGRTTEDGDDPAVLPRRVDDDEKGPIHNSNPADQQGSNISNQDDNGHGIHPTADSSLQDRQTIDTKENEPSGFPENARDVTETNSHVEEASNIEEPLQAATSEAIPERDEAKDSHEHHEKESKLDENEESKSAEPDESVETESPDENSKPDENEEEYKPTEAQPSEESIEPREEDQNESLDEDLEDVELSKPAETQPIEESTQPQEQEVRTESVRENIENHDNTNLEENEESKPAETQEEPSQESGKDVIPSEKQDEPPSDPSVDVSDSDNGERELDQPVEEATDDKEAAVVPAEDDSQEQKGEVDGDLNVEQEPQEDFKAEHEEETEPFEKEESAPSDPADEAAAAEQRTSKATIIVDDATTEDSQVVGKENETAQQIVQTTEAKEETAHTEQVVDSLEPKESETTKEIQETAVEETAIADEGAAKEAHSIPSVAPSRTRPSEEARAKMDGKASPAEIVRARPKPDLTGLTSDAHSSAPEQQDADNKELSSTKPSASVPATSVASSGKSSASSSLNSRKTRTPRVPRKKGSSGALEESGDDETEVRQRPKYTGDLHSLHKPDHSRTRRKNDQDEYTAASEGADTGGGDQNLIPLPGAFAFSSVPSEEDVLVNATDSSDQASQSDGSRLTEAETIATAVLARELNEEELEANRLENEQLRREVSHMRRERENVEVVVAVHTDEIVDDGKDSSNEGTSLACKLGILIVFLVLIGGGVAAFFLLGKDNTEPDISPKSDLPCVSESLIFPLGLCVGDCDVDNDCEDGLECFQRDKFVAVPGCSCGEEEDSNNDYCVKKQLPPLIESNNFPLALCHGDCDDDADCQEGLVCFQRGPGQEVPQCTGGADDGSASDYCIQGEKRDEEEPQFLGECQGQCNEDSDCELGLFCYYQRGSGGIPGCPDIAEDASTDLFCVKEVYRDPELIETNVFPLGLCEGECDDDTDCQEGFFCYQRGPFQDVPGCSGGGNDESSSDYCVKDIYRDSTPLFFWGDHLVGLPRENFGSSASLSGDGQILVVGAKDNESAGYVNVYKATNSDTPGIPGAKSSSSPLSSSVIWTQVTSLVGETDGKAFGSKSALSSDGRTLVVGSVIVPTNGRLAARIQVFQATDTDNGADFSNWTTVEAVYWNVTSSNDTCFNSTSSNSTFFNGTSSNSTSFNFTSSNSTSFNCTSSSETRTRTVFEMIGDTYDGDSFDFSVSISSDGKYVVLGQTSNGRDKPGSIQRGPLIFRKDQDNGTDVMTFLGTPFASLYAGSSATISTSSDGNPRVAAGGDNSVRGNGQVRVMELMGDDAVKQPETEAELLGWFEVANSIGQSDDTMVELSSDGNFMALSITNRTSIIYPNIYGIETEDVSLVGPEHVLVYQFKKQGVDDYWDQIGNLIGVSTSDVSHMPTVALSDDGQVLAVGEPWVNANTGRVRVFKYNPRSNRWQPLQRPIEGLTQGELFGFTLSLVGGLSGSSGSATLAVGGPFSASNQFGRGSVRCYQVTEDSMLMESESQTSITPNLRGSMSRIQEIALDLNWST